jgi:hypothetical protein
MNNLNGLTSYNTHEGVLYSNRRTLPEAWILKGMEIDIFSHQVNNDLFENVLSEICSTNFGFKKIRIAPCTSTFYISPMDHCLVEGGMMYTSAISILSSLSSKGILVKSFRTDEIKVS